MKYHLFGADVELDLDKATFPTPEELQEMDEMNGNPIHGFIASRYQGKKLHYLKFLPKDTSRPPKAVCIYEHGIHAHSGMTCILTDFTNDMQLSDGLQRKYEYPYTNTGLVARAFTNAGFAFYILDMLGHGFSEGERFYIPNQGDWTIPRDDLDTFARFIVSEQVASMKSQILQEQSIQEKTLPVFLMGNSFGACLAIHVAKKWQDSPLESPARFCGLGLLAPAIIGDLPPWAVVFTLRYCLAPIFPKWTPFFMPHPVPPERIWRNHQVRREFSSETETKRALHGSTRSFRLGTAVGLLNALESVREEIIPHLTIPFAVAHGTHDFGVPISGSEFLLQHSKTNPKDQVMRKVDGAFHDLLSEPSREETVQFFISWMNERIQLID